MTLVTKANLEKYDHLFLLPLYEVDPSEQAASQLALSLLVQGLAEELELSPTTVPDLSIPGKVEFMLNTMEFRAAGGVPA